MLKSLRRVGFPDNLQTSGSVISAGLIRHVKCHEELMEKAHDSAQEVLNAAKVEAQRIRENIQSEVAESIKNDVAAIKKMTCVKEKALLDRSSALCMEVCTAVFQQVLQDLPAREKIRALVEALLDTAHHGRMLQLCCHPEQLELVRSEVGRVMAEQMNMRQWNVTGSHDLQIFEIVINTPNGAEIHVSLDNLLAIYKDEIDALGEELAPLIQTNEEDDANTH